MAQAAGGRAVFYQVRPENLSLYADAGLRAFKLGEAAEVDLARFDLKGASARRPQARQQPRHPRGAHLRTVTAGPGGGGDRRAAGGLHPWLAEHKAREKRFSIGAFDRAYVSALPAAVVRREGRIIAFATVMTTELKQEATVDLMRFAPDAPASTMEFLFVNLLLSLKAEGYQRFDLGMAPLSGLNASPAAPFWHRLGCAVFEHGERFYNFHGLRAFKAKFQPNWQPRYLAITGGANAMVALADVAVLIGGGLKGVVGK